METTLIKISYSSKSFYASIHFKTYLILYTILWNKYCFYYHFIFDNILNQNLQEIVQGHKWNDRAQICILVVYTLHGLLLSQISRFTSIYFHIYIMWTHVFMFNLWKQNHIHCTNVVHLFFLTKIPKHQALRTIWIKIGDKGK